MSNLQLEHALRFDPLDTAEQITGTRYKEDRATALLGLELAQQNAAIKEAMLHEANDTMFTNKLSRYVEIITGAGFVEIDRYPFSAKSYGDETRPEENLFLFAHEAKGLLLCFDTYRGESINSGHLYYNWRPHDLATGWAITSSGHYTKEDVWVGDHDCREALLHKIARLSEHGDFVTPWIEQPFLWLVGHGENTDIYKEIGMSRLAAAPDWVRKFTLGQR